MKIFYIHHALREKGNPPSQDDGITDLGKDDAKTTAKIFGFFNNNGKNIKAIYTSPYFRCAETARIINKNIKAPVFEDERLNEFASVHQAVKYGLPKEAAETWEACQNRIIDCLKDIVERFDEDDIVLCVTSGVNLTAFICLAYQIKPSDSLPFPLVPSCSPIGFEISKSSFDFLKE